MKKAIQLYVNLVPGHKMQIMHRDKQNTLFDQKYIFLSISYMADSLTISWEIPSS